MQPGSPASSAVFLKYDTTVLRSGLKFQCPADSGSLGLLLHLLPSPRITQTLKHRATLRTRCPQVPQLQNDLAKCLPTEEPRGAKTQGNFAFRFYSF